MKDDKLLRRYLLGDLPAEQEKEIEISYLGDGELFAEIKFIEDELIDDYIRDDLSEEERKQFEQHFLATPARRDKIAAARLLMQMKPGDDRLLHGMERRTSFWQLPAIRNPGFGYGVAIAFLLLGILSSAYFLRELNLRNTSIAQIETDRTALENENQTLKQQAATQKTTVDNLTQQLQELQSRLKQELQSIASPIKKLALNLGGLRGQGKIRELLLDEPNISIVELQLNLEKGQTYSIYRATLMPDEGREILRQSGLEARTAESGKAIFLQMPTLLFQHNQLYIVQLEGRQGVAEDFERIGNYPFRVFLK